MSATYPEVHRPYIYYVDSYPLPHRYPTYSAHSFPPYPALYKATEYVFPQIYRPLTTITT